MTDPRTLLADIVTALIDPYSTAEPYEVDGVRRIHRIQHASLIDQLAAAIEPGVRGIDARSIPASRPSARLDAIDRLLAIQAGTALRLFAAGVRPVDDTKVNIRKLVGIDWPQAEWSNLAKTVAVWLAWARTVTGWDTPPFRPNVRCPIVSCNTLGSLRVRLDQRTACCVECGAAWDTGTIGILAEHVRAAKGEILA